MVNTVHIAGKIKIRYFIAISLDTAGFVPSMIWATGFHRQENILNKTITKTFLVQLCLIKLSRWTRSSVILPDVRCLMLNP